MADTDSNGRTRPGKKSSEGRDRNQINTAESKSCDVSFANCQRLQITRHEPEIKEIQQKDGATVGNRRAAQPGLGGVVDGVPCWLDEPDGVPRITTGIPNRCDRLKCLGNAVVPQQFYPIFRAIAEIMED